MTQALFHGTWAIAGASILAWMLRDHFWLAANAAEFSPHAIVILAVASIVAIALSAPNLGFLFMIAITFWSASWMENRYDTKAANALVNFRAASVNALTANPRPEAIADWLRSETPDVAVIVETTPAINQALEAVSDLYPWRITALRINQEGPKRVLCGITLLSRHPITASDVLEPIGRADRPLLWAKIQGPQGDLMLAGMHPPPPRGSVWEEERTRYLHDGMSELSQIAGGLPALAIGDFNATPWSAAFARMSDGWQIHSPGGATWPVVLGPAGIPIDLAATHGAMSIVKPAIGPRIGSDHAPILWSAHIKETRS